MLAELHEIASDKRTKFQSRLKNLHRIGFPRNIRPGRPGSWASYGPGEIVQMLIVCELLQLGIPPKRAAKILDTDMYLVANAAQEGGGALLEDTPSRLYDFLLPVDPKGLSELSEPSLSGEDPSSAELIPEWTGGLIDRLQHGQFDERRLAIVNTTVVIRDAARIIARLKGLSVKEVGSTIGQWGRDFDWDAYRGDS